LDPHDLESAARLARQYGDLFRPGLEDLPLFSANDQTPKLIEEARVLEMARCQVPMGDLYHKSEVALHFEALSFLGRFFINAQRPGAIEEMIRTYLTEEAALQRIAIIRDTVNETAWEHLDSEINGPDFHERAIRIEYLRMRERFRDLLDAGLAIFHVGLEPPEKRATTIYSGACLQMYNLLVERATIRICANERCRRSFVNQRGTARYGQYRVSGVKYCSPSCGKAQNERMRRRRSKAG
jgi:hypothetical protein